MEFLIAMGVPTAITGFLIWLLKRHIDKKDHRTEQREENIEKLMLMIIQTSRATVVLAEATAKAVQRIPDAHCNGDMAEALKKADEIQKEEQEFLISHGIQRMFSD